MKDALIERWRNGIHKVQELEIWGGVEVSLCTQNARRRTLRHLLGSASMRNYLRGISFKWHEEDCERQYFEALEDCKKFRSFWKNNPQWHGTVGNAINECFSALEETGVDERDDELAVLWIEVVEELDKDESDEDALGDNCCRWCQQHQCLLDSSKGHWDMMSIKRSSTFSLGIRGLLTLYREPLATCDPLLMEWEPLQNALGKELKADFNERVLGKSSDRHHSEYTGGQWNASPVPCLLISKTVN
ncbi:hypothetical protein AOQ84DRAFT_317685, partial [Glonium stellatum]